MKTNCRGVHAREAELIDKIRQTIGQLAEEDQEARNPGQLYKILEQTFREYEALRQTQGAAKPPDGLP